MATAEQLGLTGGPKRPPKKKPTPVATPNAILGSAGQPKPSRPSPAPVVSTVNSTLGGAGVSATQAAAAAARARANGATAAAADRPVRLPNPATLENPTSAAAPAADRRGVRDTRQTQSFMDLNPIVQPGSSRPRFPITAPVIRDAAKEARRRTAVERGAIPDIEGDTSFSESMEAIRNQEVLASRQPTTEAQQKAAEALIARNPDMTRRQRRQARDVDSLGEAQDDAAKEARRRLGLIIKRNPNANLSPQQIEDLIFDGNFIAGKMLNALEEQDPTFARLSDVRLPEGEVTDADLADAKKKAQQRGLARSVAKLTPQQAQHVFENERFIGTTARGQPSPKGKETFKQALGRAYRTGNQRMIDEIEAELRSRVQGSVSQIIDQALRRRANPAEAHAQPKRDDGITRPGDVRRATKGSVLAGAFDVGALADIAAAIPNAPGNIQRIAEGFLPGIAEMISHPTQIPQLIDEAFDQSAIGLAVSGDLGGPPDRNREPGRYGAHPLRGRKHSRAGDHGSGPDRGARQGGKGGGIRSHAPGACFASERPCSLRLLTKLLPPPPRTSRRSAAL